MTAKPVLTVGIGASAGGLEALTQFFNALPSDTGMAFVVVQHLSPDFKSMMPELLARHTSMPIDVATAGAPLLPDHVYVNFPRTDLTVRDGRLVVEPWEGASSVHRPIDALFRSLAEDCPDRAVAILLSGSGTDGAIGFEILHEAGGLTLVQDPSSAQFEGMPAAAAATGAADFAVSPGQMPELLAQHAQTPFTLVDPGAGEEPRDTFDQIYALLKRRIRIDFSQYKPTTAARRVRRRADRQGMTVESYVDLLRQDEEEQDQLYRDLLIGVTEFFRDRDAYRILEREILPALAERATEDDPVRVWVAGCATGEEAYSIAILLAEATRSTTHFQIFATDVHPGSLRAASFGTFPRADLRVPRDLLSQYFEETPAGWQVRADLRRSIVFAPHDLLSDAPFSRVDLACCRNVLIYLKNDAQHRALARLHFSLKLGGHLFLGPSETLGPFDDQYSAVDRRWKLFTKTSDVRPALESLGRQVQPAVRPVRVRDLSPPPHLMSAYDRVLDRFAPPGLLLDAEHNLLHTFGTADRYLQVPKGRVTQDVLQLIVPELKPALGAALHKAGTGERDVAFTATIDGERVEVGVTCLDLGEHRPAYHFVTLGPVPALQRPTAMTARERSDAENHHLDDLERELVWTRASLQSTMEAADVVNEELQSTNEELVAANEELQSTNEELQSVNEELHTVNAEYQEANVELRHLTADLDLLLRSTRIGVVFLDAELRVRRFTPEATRVFRLLPQDIGRYLADITSSVRDLPFVEDARAILRGETGRIERQIVLPDGMILLYRTLPYVSEQDEVLGTVLSFVDITRQAEAERELVKARNVMETVLDAVPTGAVMFDAQRRYRFVGRPYATRLGIPAAELIGRHVDAVVTTDRAGRAARHARALAGEAFDVRSLERDGRFYDVFYRPVVELGEVTGFVEGYADVTSHVVEARAHAHDARIVARLPMGVLVLDARDSETCRELRIVSVNDAVSTLCGFDAGQSVGSPLVELFPALFASPLVDKLMGPSTTGERRVVETEYADERVARTWWRVSVTRMEGNRLLLVIEDVEEERRLREQHVSNLRLEAVAAVAGGVAHDLNNMLGAILLTGRALRAELSDKLPETILATTHRAADLVARLMDFTRQRVVAPKVVSLSDTIAAAAPVIRGLMGSSVDVELVLGVDTTALLDPSVVDQVLVNLATNARFAMPNGGKLTVGVRRVNDPVIRQRTLTGPHVEWTVTDTGEGMDPVTLDRCFEPFFTTRPRGVGTGKGLAMVHGVVGQAQGAIEALSSSGHGTTIRMLFPLAVSHTSAELDPAPSEPKAVLPRGLKVLLVDDEELLRRATVRGLVRRGLDVVEASSAAAALELIDGGLKPDVLVTDVLMPGMNGPALLEELARLGHQIPAILMSGYTHAALRTHLWEGAIYVPKPFTYEQLESAIRQALPDLAQA